MADIRAYADSLCGEASVLSVTLTGTPCTIYKMYVNRSVDQSRRLNYEKSEATLSCFWMFCSFSSLRSLKATESLSFRHCIITPRDEQ
jgi:hypothetical protein